MWTLRRFESSRRCALTIPVAECLFGTVPDLPATPSHDELCFWKFWRSQELLKPSKLNSQQLTSALTARLEPEEAPRLQKH